MTDLRSVLTERLDAMTVPAGHLDQARDTGRRIRRRRRVAVAGVAALAVTGGVGVTTAIDDSSTTVPDESRFASLGTLDFSDGVRAYADPGQTVHLGGREFPADELEYLDTDAVATPYGIVFYDLGRPMLLGPSGDVRPLVEPSGAWNTGFHPTAKADSTAPLVAWATQTDGTATITVRNMATGRDVASTEVECGGCDELVIEALDDGVVFVRDGDGTRTWDSATGQWAEFAGPDTRIADVRNGVVLHDGPAPSAPGGWRTVVGPTDAKLTFDGRHVLSWSSRLEPTSRGGAPLELEHGPTDGGLGFWSLDTDGSVLVAELGKNYAAGYTVYDCELPSGACEELGPLDPESGDPMFIGNDM